MNELKPENVMRALELCKSCRDRLPCDDCPYFRAELGDDESCINRMAQDVLALLREKDALLVEWDAKCNDYETELMGKDAEIERLKNSITFQVVMPDEKMEEIKAELLARIHSIRAEAITEFSERVKGFFADGIYDFGDCYFEEWLDQTEKEMKGETE